MDTSPDPETPIIDFEPGTEEFLKLLGLDAIAALAELCGSKNFSESDRSRRATVVGFHLCGSAPVLP